MSSPLLPGTKLGRYEIHSQLGAGGMGEVYLAEDKKLERKVALKILPADVAAHHDRMRRFVQEAKAVSALNHPNILTIYEIEQIDSLNFIATEFIDGETLRQRTKGVPLKPGEVLDVSAQIASALAAAHAAGIVHRDIKPENVMLRRDGIVKVLDFGLAKLTERPPPELVDTEAPTSVKTDPGTVIGTALYMSPEQARGLQVDARTDIFSLGVLVYEMIAGRLPFEGSNSLDESGRRSLWTKHLATGSRVPIVPASEALALNASMFSNDGSYVYYTRVDEQNPRGALYQVPVLGGTSKKILTNVSQPISLSPDGKQIAFGRFHMTRTEDELLLANADGSNERHLITVAEPAWLSGAGPTWSPDGTMLAIGYGSDDMVPAVISIADGKLKPLTSRRWDYVGRVAWFSDGRGLVFTAREQVLGALQVWQQSYPQGEGRRVTNDLSSYGFYSLALTADSKALVSVQGDPGSNIWIAPEGDASRARAATASKNVQEGHYNLAWTPDGRVVFDSNENVKASIWIVAADGSNPKMLTDGSADDFAPEVSPDGRFIIFNSGRAGSPQAFRIGLDGGEVQQLTRGVGGVATHSISPDGKWLLYSPFTGGIRKLSLDGGTDAEIVTKGNLRYPQLSPDGKLLAYFFDDEQTNRPRIAVIEFGSGAAVRTFDLPVTSQSSFYESLFYRGLHWSSDGRAIVYINTLGGVSNLWSQPLDGSTAKQITDFKSDLIYNFAYSRDGHQLALARGSHTRDAVLISKVK